MPDDVFPLERHVYAQVLPHLLAHHPGRWAVVCGERVAVCDSEDAALRWGYATYGRGAFVVKRIEEAERVETVGRQRAGR